MSGLPWSFLERSDGLLILDLAQTLVLIRLMASKAHQLDISCRSRFHSSGRLVVWLDSSPHLIFFSRRNNSIQAQHNLSSLAGRRHAAGPATNPSSLIFQSLLGNDAPERCWSTFIHSTEPSIVPADCNFNGSSGSPSTVLLVDLGTRGCISTP